MAIPILDEVQILYEPIADGAFAIEKSRDLIEGRAVNLPATGEFSRFPPSRTRNHAVSRLRHYLFLTLAQVGSLRLVPYYIPKKQEPLLFLRYGYATIARRKANQTVRLLDQFRKQPSAQAVQGPMLHFLRPRFRNRDNATTALRQIRLRQLSHHRHHR